MLLLSLHSGAETNLTTTRRRSFAGNHWPSETSGNQTEIYDGNGDGGGGEGVKRLNLGPKRWQELVLKSFSHGKKSGRLMRWLERAGQVARKPMLVFGLDGSEYMQSMWPDVSKTAIYEKYLVNNNGNNNNTRMMLYHHLNPNDDFSYNRMITKNPLPRPGMLLTLFLHKWKVNIHWHRLNEAYKVAENARKFHKAMLERKVQTLHGVEVC